ncbi:MAG TPA: MmcQ/YjbR family DNA-binding protein [Devosia sp.]|nr:MmcQ/YjbR family DNA-binding protein [Devosia sp.]
MVKDGKQKAFERVSKIARRLKLDEIAEGTNYGDPALKVRGKAFITVKAADTMVLPCPLEMKEVMMGSAPHIYYETPHFVGWPGLLVRLDVIGDEELALRIEDAWHYKAPKSLSAARKEKAG